MSQVNPVALVAASLGLAACLISTVDWVSAAVALGLELLILAVVRPHVPALARRTSIVGVAAVLTAVTIALYGPVAGAIHAEFLLARVSDGSLSLAAATLLRVLAIGLPAVVLFAAIDPTELADGLAQRMHLPARFVLGALAGVRLISLFVDDWRALELARRARGIADSGRVRRLAGQAFGLLVLSLRRATVLATAMEARGFGAPVARTWARESRWRRRDWVVMLAGPAVGAVAVTASVLAGTGNFIGG